MALQASRLNKKGYVEDDTYAATLCVVHFLSNCVILSQFLIYDDTFYIQGVSKPIIFREANRKGDISTTSVLFPNVAKQRMF
jgi:hypothetical protein